MHRRYGTNTPDALKQRFLLEKAAFHEAGHVVAVYWWKKHNNFPDSLYSDDIDLLCCNKQQSKLSFPDHNEWSHFPVSGEQHIVDPPVSIIETIKLKPLFDKKGYQLAFKANIVNLLTGPLAEAKYVALRDDESFNDQLIHVGALGFYSGTADLEHAHAYLNNFIDSKQARYEVMRELFKRAFAFIEEPPNWKIIASLANLIVQNHDRTLSCTEVFAVLDQYVEILTKAVNKIESPVLSA